MASKFVVFVTLLAACNAGPVWFNDVLPGTIVRVGRAPSISYGFGTGYSSNIGGVSQSTGFGTAFNSGGGGPTYASGTGIADGGYARGVGIAGSYPQPIPTVNTYPVYQVQPTYVPRPVYGNAVSSAGTFGGFNSAISSANSAGGQALSSAQNFRGYESAISSANNGFNSASSAATNNGYGHQTAIASTRHSGPGQNSHSVSAVEQQNGYRASTAQTYQQLGNTVQNSGASSINGPGIRAAHSHAVQTNGFY